MNLFATAFSVMLALVVAELLVMQFWQKRPIPWSEIVANLNSGHVLMWVFRGVEVALFGWVLAHANLHWVDQLPAALQWAFAFVAWDFSFYWMHRMHHKVPLFWAVHVVHHQGEHFSLSLGIRNSWYSSLTSFVFTAPLAVLGVPLDIFVVVSTIHYAIQFYNHTGLVNSSGILDRLIVTPSNHRVHHGNDPLYRNRNFGGTLLVWDKLFGTYQAQVAGVPMEHGLHGGTPSHNPLWLNHVDWLRALRRRFPQLQNLARLAMPEWLIGTGGCILFGVVIYYVDHDSDFAGGLQGALFALLFLSTLALGGMSDGKRWGAVAWVAMAAAAPALFLGAYGLRDTWAEVFFAAMALHGLEVGRRLATQRFITV